MEVESKHNPVSQPFCAQTPASHDMGSCSEWLIIEDTSLQYGTFTVGKL